LDELNRFGVKDNDVTVIVAGGMHVSPPEEIKRKFGSELMKRVNIITHDPHQNLRFMGTTSRGTPVFINEIAADAGLRIGIGGIKGAHFAGYSGGPKIILPGISGDKTILHNHLMFRDENCKLCKLDGNPIWEDMLEAARLAHLDMKIDVVLNTRNEVALISAGEAEQAQKAAVKFFNEIYRIPVPKQADVEIVAGYPLDRELGQSLLAVVTNREVVRDGGTFLVASAAPGGIMEGFAHPLKLGLTSDDIMDQMTKGGQSPSGGPGISRFMEIKEKKAVYVVSDGISKEQVVGMNLRHDSTHSEGVMELAATYPSADVIISPTCMVLPYVQN
jgi:nickel-dependent lactate racemase